MPVLWYKVVSKTIGIIVRLVGRNGGLGPRVPNMFWHVRVVGSWGGVKVEDREGMLVSTAGQGGN